MHPPRPNLSHALWPFLFVALACAPPEGVLEISIQPLELHGVHNACYDLHVRRGNGERVWWRQDLCSQGPGAQGSLTYVGPCDATDPTHDVDLVLKSLTDDTDTPIDFTNPCPPPLGCTLQAECIENTDTRVNFNLTLLRPAQQGFFDIDVLLDDIYCSAKFDTCYGTKGEPCYIYAPEEQIKKDKGDARGDHTDKGTHNKRPADREYVYQQGGQWVSSSEGCWDDPFGGPYVIGLGYAPPEPFQTDTPDVWWHHTGETLYTPASGGSPDDLDWITLLSGYDDNQFLTQSPGRTGVIALACTAGPGLKTFLITDNPTIQCTTKGGSDILIEAPIWHPDLPESPFEGTALPTPFEASSLLTIGIGDKKAFYATHNAGNGPLHVPWQWAVYSGMELLRCPSQNTNKDKREDPLDAPNCGKIYLNTAIGLDGIQNTDFTSCRLNFTGTAVHNPQGLEDRMPLTYPFIHWDIELIDDEGDLRCMQNALGTSGGVQVDYHLCSEAAGSCPEVELIAHHPDGLNPGTGPLEILPMD